MKQIEVFDLETLKNCFTACFLNARTKQYSEFVIHKDLDQRKELYDFINQDISLVGFNCVNFDTPILQFIYDNIEDPKLITKIYKLAQKLIEAERNFRGSVRWEQRDLFLINHYNNKTRMMGLKELQLNMGFPSIMEMPIHHSEKITKEQIPTVQIYNRNDVDATLKLYELCFGKIRLRSKLSKKYEVDMGNYPDTKIGETIVLKMLSDKMGISMDSLKNCRTPRKEVIVNDIIIPEIEFKSSEFKEVLGLLRKSVFTKDTIFEHTVKFDGCDYVMGMGGLHMCRGTAIYKDVHSCDVTGFYPSLAVQKQFSPAHFGTDFSDVYRQIAVERSQYPKGSDDNVALKLSQNGIFGKTNNEYSPFYDPKMFYQITINGQLLLAMLCEQLTLSGAATVILANTDGIEVDVKDKLLYDEICGNWEKVIGLKLEHSVYKTLIVRDINNYLAIKYDGKTKEKGAFVCEPELEKNHSQLVVPISIREFFTNGVPVETTIRNADIGKFLIGQRAKKGKFYLRKVNGGTIVDEDLQKTIRYYIANSGDYLRKKTDATDGFKHVGYRVSMFNTWLDEPYDVNYRYYELEAKKILDLFTPKLELF